MYSTFNIPAGFEGRCARKRQSEDLMYNSYYQWVALCLVGQVGQVILDQVRYSDVARAIKTHLKASKMLGDFFPLMCLYGIRKSVIDFLCASIVRLH